MSNTMLYMIIAAGVVLLVIIFLAGLLTRRRPKNLNKAYYKQAWDTLEKLLKEKATWPLAIIDADKLLDDALKRRHYRGKTMGERLVAAQHEIKKNDDVWFSHKLRNRLVHESNVALRERDVKSALLGIQAALKDLGAL